MRSHIVLRALPAVFAAGAMTACGSGGKAQGGEGGACYPNGTCDEALVCLSDACVRPVGGDAGAPDGESSDAAAADAAPPDTGAQDPATDSTLLCFDGVDDSGRSVAMQAAVATLTAATVEFWFRSSDPSSERQFFVFHTSNLNTGGTVAMSITDASAQNFGALSGRVLYVAVDARDNGGNLNARGFDIDAALPTFVETDWHHYAMILTGSTQRAFIDGHELTTVQQRDGQPNTSFADAFGQAFVTAGGQVFLDVGVFPRDAIRYAAGYFEDIRISKNARYTGPFTPDFPLVDDAATAVIYPIDEGTGTVSADVASGHYDMTWTGSTWVACSTSHSLRFDGVNDVLSSSSALGRGLSSTMTAEYWFRPTSIGPWMKLLNIHNADNRDVDMELRPDGHVYCSLFDQSGGNHGSTSTSALVGGVWYHIACSYDGSTQRMFVNGALEASTGWTGQVQLNDIVSISGFEARYIAGDIDEFRLSSSARYTASFTPPAHLANDANAQVLWLFDEGSGSTSEDKSGHGRSATLGVGPGAGGPPSWVLTDR